MGSRLELHKISEITRKHFPQATELALQTSDQNYYGFIMTNVLVNGESPENATRETILALDDELFDYLCDLDWNDEVGEDQYGMANLKLEGT